MEYFLGLLKEVGVPAGVVISLAIMWLLWKIGKSITVIGFSIASLQEDVKGLVNSKMWVNQCNERHEAIQRTLDNHETRIHDLEKDSK